MLALFPPNRADRADRATALSVLDELDLQTFHLRRNASSCYDSDRRWGTNGSPHHFRRRPISSYSLVQFRPSTEPSDSSWMEPSACSLRVQCRSLRTPPG